MMKRSYVVAHYIEMHVKSSLRDYREPERKGTPKGDKIGMSKRKKFAAMFCAAYPLVSLRYIAERCGVSLGVLRVWRTQDDFKRETGEFAYTYGAMIDITSA